MKKKILSLLLVVCLGLSMVGCGGNDVTAKVTATAAKEETLRLVSSTTTQMSLVSVPLTLTI